ncbi:MAG: hypothetical protein IKB99_02375 [Lentisphaeria bacterium]|nr:hypothetical protein [Lentisphaeria bacterium]
MTNRCIEKYIYAKPGDQVESFTGANTALGVLLMKYKSREDMKYIIENFEKMYAVELEV